MKWAGASRRLASIPRNSSNRFPNVICLLAKQARTRASVDRANANQEPDGPLPGSPVGSLLTVILQNEQGGSFQLYSPRECIGNSETQFPAAQPRYPDKDLGGQILFRTSLRSAGFAFPP